MASSVRRAFGSPLVGAIAALGFAPTAIPRLVAATLAAAASRRHGLRGRAVLTQDLVPRRIDVAQLARIVFAELLSELVEAAH